jgi:hypothetical protein
MLKKSRVLNYVRERALIERPYNAGNPIYSHHLIGRLLKLGVKRAVIDRA